MGCNNSSHSLKESEIGNILQQLIDKDDQALSSQLSLIKKQFSKLDHNILDKPTILHKSTLVSPLTYSVLNNKPRSFSCLISSGCSFEPMEQFFTSIKKYSINFIYTGNNSELIKEFLPVYLEKTTAADSNQQPVDQTKLFYDLNEYPIHASTRMGFLQNINVTNQFFKDNPHLVCPKELNPHSLNSDGENCGLIACRLGLPRLLIHFYEECKIDLNINNSYGDNVMIICMHGFRRERKMTYDQCIKYLIEETEVDITDRYQDFMRIATFNEDIFRYLKEKLMQKHIVVNSLEIMALEKSSDLGSSNNSKGESRISSGEFRESGLYDGRTL